ncbi:hypothetical protein FQN50_005892 [Emmonsiellopsis sp. PD_5]|nr:hypothetical protein FQN50_005892 [Emmonsiellopsis sp. PD_5]
MASDTPMSDASPPPSPGPANHNGDNDVEFLATSRARRSTAGKNMATLIDAEADDELALLFAEEEDDEEFDSAEVEAGQADDEGVDDEADDMQLDSSSDDEEDQGPNAQEDELEGERELERQAKAERLARKRKEQEGLRFTTLRKRVKIDPTASSASPRTPTIPTAPRPKKKSERISWLPTPEDGPTRSSSRRQTMQNKELTHARLKDSEEKRVRLIATMEEAARRKEKLKPKEMTQADRLAEAARTERLNAKSLNRWEEMERRRGEEQKARLEALQNRRLEGAVVSWWSGFAKWVNGRLARVGNKEIAIDEGEGRKRKGVDGEEKRGKVRKGEKGNDKEKAVDGGDKGVDAEKAKAGSAEAQGQTQSDAKQQITFAPPQVPGSFLDGIHLYASMKDDIHGGSAAQASGAAPRTTTNTTPVPAPASQTSASKASGEPAAPPQPSTSQAPAEATPKPAETAQSSAPPPPQPSNQPIQRIEMQIPPPAQQQRPPQQESQPQQKPDQPQPTQANTNTNDPNPPSNPPTKPPTTTAVPPPPPHPPPSSLPAPAPAPAPPPVIETTSRNLIILSNFENKTPAEREEFNIFFNPRKPQKLQKTPTPLCPITSRPARHRDPETQLVYANALGYKEIRQALGSRYAWSGVLGCFVGPVGVGARGVPERFLAPNEVPRVGPVGGGGAGGGGGGGGGGV